MCAEDLSQWRLAAAFRRALGEVVPKFAAGSTWADPARELRLEEYLGLFFFALVNPALPTTRAVCAASHLERMQKEVCRRPVSLGSFSEAQHLVAVAWLEKLFARLVAQVPAAPRRDPHQVWPQWLARDSSLLPALPRMHWALYGGGKAKKRAGPNRAVRLHLSFNLLEDKPARARVTPGKTCERKVWKEQWEPGACYVGDRYFAEDYQCLRQLDAHGCQYIVRLCDQAVLTVLEELPLTAADRAAGVTKQARVRLGSRARDQIGPVRVVWVQTVTAGELRLVTNLAATDLAADLVALMYRRRWQIEDYFKWLKVLLGCRHWLAESEQGVTLQLYLALIAAVLLQLFTGQRPTKRMLELIRLHQLGWATLEELTAGIQRERDRAQRRAPKKS